MRLLFRLPLHPLLFAAYAVLFVYAANLAEVLPVDVVAPLGRVLIAAATVLAIAALAYRDARRGAIVATAIVLAVAFFGHLAPTLEGVALDEPAQLIVWLALVVGAALYAAFARRSLATATLALNAVGLVLLAFSLVTIVPFEAGRAARASGALAPTDQPAAIATRLPERDIYFLVFDRYGSEWALEHRFGITDNDLPEWLEGQGFQVIPGARTNYRATDFSIATTLNMRLLDDLSTSVGTESSDRTPARERIPRHAVGDFLRANGYRYYQMGAWYEPTMTSEIADEVLAWGRTTEFASVLRDASIFPAVDRLTGASTSPEPEFRDRHRNMALFEFRQLERLAGVPGRKFVFAHILLPHPPYVFRPDGSPIWDAEEKAGPEGPLFADQLKYTNARIRELVETLLAGPDETDPIIVLTGDEGPFICYNVDCVDGSPESLGIRFGVFRAYHLPGQPAGSVPADDTSVNIFRRILREYFGADLPDLPNRSYNWPDNDHLYEFHDITDQLPLPGSAGGAGSAGAGGSGSSGGSEDSGGAGGSSEE